MPLPCGELIDQLVSKKRAVVQIFLSQAAAGAEIFTAKASEVNISLIQADDEDPSEHALPEQFVSRFVSGRLVTEAVSHSGG